MLTKKSIWSIFLVTSLMLNVILGVRSANLFTEAEEDKNNNNVRIEETVKLYSNGKVVQQWNGDGKGQMENGTYIFRVGEGAFPKQVRIHGTFSVERVNR